MTVGTKYKFFAATVTLLTGAIFFFIATASVHAESSWGDDLTITKSAWSMPESSGGAATKAGKAVAEEAAAEAARAHASYLDTIAKMTGTEASLRAASEAEKVAIEKQRDAA